MLEFHEYVDWLNRLDRRLKDLDLHIEYRLIELGCSEPESGRCMSAEQRDRAENDKVMRELLYLRNQCCKKKEYLQANGVMPPEEDSL
jgi:hypothetical protein